MQEDIDVKENPTMEQMLRAVRNIMTKGMSEEDKKEAVTSEQAKPGDGVEKKAETAETGDAVLELSETSLVEEKPDGADAEKKEADQEGGDVLDNIDNLLDEKTEGEAKSAGEPVVAEGEEKVEDAAEPQPEEAEAKAEEAAPAEGGETKDEDAPKEELAEGEVKAEEAPVAEAPVEEESKLAEGEESKPEGNIAEPKEESKEALVSETAAAESADVLRDFKKTVEKPISDGLSFRGGTTMEELVIELIKPKLSEWLDENLPGIVKHVVEREVKKLIPDDD
jgi:uncharacterized protein